MEQNIYTRSNAMTEVSLSKFRKTEYNRLLKCGEGRLERQLCGQALLDYLCGKFHMESVKLCVTDKPQKHHDYENGKTKSKIFGWYATNRQITIYNTTAKIGKIVSIKVFTDTLLHEFMHHYDHYYLKFAKSPHTCGFYCRIGDLQRKLKD